MTDGASAGPEVAPVPIWRRTWPLLLAAVLVGFVLYRMNWAEFLRALGSINYPAFLGFTLLFSAALLTADVFATAHVYRTRICPVTFKEVFVLRGASYLPSMLNHHVGQGWLTYFMAKTYQAPLWRVTGATLLVYATTFACVYLLGVVALLLNPTAIAWLLPTILGVGAMGVLYLALLWLRPGILKSNPATAPLGEAGLRGHLVAMAYRLPHVVVLFVGTWAPFWFFGVDVPLSDALAYIPVVMLVAALPITPQGIGTRDVIALQLLAQYAGGDESQRAATLAAATLSWAAALTVVQALISPWFMRSARALLRERQG